MLICLNCQHENIVGSLFCESCGAALDEAAPFAAIRPRHQTSSLMDPGSGNDGPEPPDTVVLDDRGTETEEPVVVELPPESYFLITSSGRHIPVPSKLQVIVGRSDARSGVQPDIDLTQDGAQQSGVSRRHCRLIWDSGQWLVEDLMSTNYTSVNGTRLPSHTPTPVHQGDEIRLGKLSLTFMHGLNAG
jgi:pSer/pThr/pTyr-binding forkhead associated (FHA) protein